LKIEKIRIESLRELEFGVKSREFEIERVRIGVESTKYNPILYIYEIRGKMVFLEGLNGYKRL